MYFLLHFHVLHVLHVLQLVQILLKKFCVTDNPKKFSLYEEYGGDCKSVFLCTCIYKYTQTTYSCMYMYMYIHVHGMSCVYCTNHNSDLIEPACIQTGVVASTA